jgi:hypothetical protein
MSSSPFPAALIALWKRWRAAIWRSVGESPPAVPRIRTGSQRMVIPGEIRAVS